MNLSSVVVFTRPENLAEVIENLKKSMVCEYHIHDENGRIIVTIEGKDTDEAIGKLAEINQIPHVVSADLVFAYSEDELEKEREQLEKSGDHIPDWLNDPDAKIGDIRYGGDLKKRF